MLQRYERPLKLRTNKIPYLIPGGHLIERFLGETEREREAGKEPASQMWIASVVQSALEGAGESRSYIEEEDGDVCLAEALAQAPGLYLGEEFSRHFGATPGFLLKLLNSRDRLLVQAHPDKEKARKYFGSPFGKTESWYVLDTEPGREAYIWAGFCPGVTREYFRQLIEKQDTERILGCLHRFRVKPGDVVFIPAGLPHALGKDSLVAELQEPADITLRAERIRPDGSELPEESLHSGIGYEGLLDCFSFECGEKEEIQNRIFLKPESRKTPWGEEVSLIGRETTDCFGMKKISCTGECEREYASFAVVLVTDGEGWISYGEGLKLPVKKGAELFIPHGVKACRYVPNGSMEVLECYPPRAEL